MIDHIVTIGMGLSGGILVGIIPGLIFADDDGRKYSAIVGLCGLLGAVGMYFLFERS